MNNNSRKSNSQRFSKGDTFDGEIVDFPKFKDIVVTETMTNKSFNTLVDDTIKYPEEPVFRKPDGTLKKEIEYNNREGVMMGNYVKLRKEMDEQAMSAIGVILGLVSGKPNREVRMIIKEETKSLYQARKIWKMLKTVYEKEVEQTTVCNLIEDFTLLTMEKYGVKNLIVEMNRINDEVKQLEIESSYNDTLMKKLLMNKIQKDDRYNAVNLFVSNQKTLTYSEVCTHFIQRETQLAQLDMQPMGVSALNKGANKVNFINHKTKLDVKANNNNINYGNNNHQGAMYNNNKHNNNNYKHNKDNRMSGYQGKNNYNKNRVYNNNDKFNNNNINNKFNNNNNNNRMQYKNKFNGYCGNCGLFGHKGNNCQAPGGGMNKFSSKGQNFGQKVALARSMNLEVANDNHGDSALGAMGLQMERDDWSSYETNKRFKLNMLRVTLLAKKMDPELGMLDSGANVSVSSIEIARRIKAPVKRIRNEVEIMMADNTVVYTNLSAYFGGIIGDVYILPQVENTIISVGELTSRGFGVEFSSDQVVIKQQGRVICKGLMMEKLFLVKLINLTNLYSQSSSNTIQINNKMTNENLVINANAVTNGMTIQNSMTNKTWALRKRKSIPSFIHEPVIKLHERLGHMDPENMATGIKNNLWNFSEAEKDIITPENIRSVFLHYECISCALGKKNKLPRNFGSAISNNVVGHTLSVDYIGKILPTAYNGYNGMYFFVDCVTGYMHVFLVRTKTKLKDCVLDVISFYKKYNHIVRVLRYDSDSVQLSDDFTLFLENITNPVRSEVSIPGSHYQNPVERHIQTFIKGVSTLLHGQTTLGANFWGLAAIAWVDTRNITPNKNCSDMTPSEAVTGNKPNLEIKHKLPFGQLVSVATLPTITKTSSSIPTQQKFKTRNEIGVVIASSEYKNQGMLIYFPQRNRVLIREHVIPIKQDLFKPGADIPPMGDSQLEFFFTEFIFSVDRYK